MADKNNSSSNVRPKTTADDILPWFNSGDYEDVRTLSEKHWYAALSYRQRFRQLEETANHTDRISSKARWELFNKFRAPTRENLERAVKKYEPFWNLIALGSMTEIRVEDAESWANEGWKILAINPAAPHPKLVDQFKSWLEESPKFHPQHIKRKGNPSDNIEFNERVLASWKNDRILEVLDIDLWSAIFNRRQISQKRLIDLVLPKQLQPSGKSWSERVRKVCDESFDYLPLIAHKMAEKT